MKETEASATARLIAMSMVFLAKDETFESLVPREASEMSKWFVEESDSFTERSFLKRVDKKSFRSLLWGLERISLPGILLHYLLRKLYLEEIVRMSLQEAFQQVVVLGAGFDTLALRLCREHPNVLFIELDHPLTQRVKETALSRHKIQFKNLTFVPADFSRQSLREIFSQTPGVNLTVNTLFIAEGVLMYLTSQKAAALFESLQAFRVQCRFAFTSMEPTKNGRLQFHNASPMVNLWLRLKNEPFRWGIPQENLPGFLSANGFKLCEIAEQKTFRERYLSNSQKFQLAKGEYIAVAQRA